MTYTIIYREEEYVVAARSAREAKMKVADLVGKSYPVGSLLSMEKNNDRRNHQNGR